MGSVHAPHESSLARALPSRTRLVFVALLGACAATSAGSPSDSGGSDASGSGGTAASPTTTTQPAGSTTDGSGTAIAAGPADDGAATSQGGSADTGSSADTSTSETTAGADDYDAVVLADAPVGYWTMANVPGAEDDLTGQQAAGSYHGGPVATEMPNGDIAVQFDGEEEYLQIASSPSLSIPTTGMLTWEAWIRPDVLQYPSASDDGYIDWMGKCADYAPTCEWEARMYATNNPEDRPNRFSAYVFNPGAGLGSAADWQPEPGLIQAGQWYHVVAEYTLLDQPDDCDNADQYPGAIDIWVNGVAWDHASHGQTGCMSQYAVTPEANDSPIKVATMAQDTWFPGAVGKLAIYDYLLDEADITHHYTVMTGLVPTGSCGDTCSF